jgi:hypothetical protein
MGEFVKSFGFPRRICAYMVGFPRGVVVRKLNKVVEVWVWLG